MVSDPDKTLQSPAAESPHLCGILKRTVGSRVSIFPILAIGNTVVFHRIRIIELLRLEKMLKIISGIVHNILGMHCFVTSEDTVFTIPKPCN